MNILLLNYGDTRSNSFKHLEGFATHLSSLGHECAIILPSEIAGPANKTIALFPFEKTSAHFQNNRPAEILHAWTPRENVRRFAERYLWQHPHHTALVVHLEDNEQALIEAHTQLSADKLKHTATRNLSRRLPQNLSHPHRFRQFLANAQGITVITERLEEFVPEKTARDLLLPGVLTAKLEPGSKSGPHLHRLRLRPNEKLIVYNGGSTFANIADIRALLEAVHLINAQGCPCRLIRTGINPPRLAEVLRPLSRQYVTELGYLAADELPPLLAIADVLVQPGAPDDFNNYRLPSKIPEFLASGKPTIIPRANIGLHMEDGRHALLLTTGSPEEIAGNCLRVFRDPFLAARLSAGAAEFARLHFDWEKNTGRLLSFYERVLANSRPVERRRDFIAPLHGWLHEAHDFLWPHLAPQPPEPVLPDDYSRWLKNYEAHPPHIDAPADSPLLSVLMPVYNTDPRWISRAIRSVEEQSYKNWELCIADDASTQPSIRRILLRAAKFDPRIKLNFRTTNGHISAASNSALHLATGDFCVLLDHDDELHPHALAEVAYAAMAHPATELIYTDEDKIDEAGLHFSPHFKPDWNPDLLISQNYLCHLTAYRSQRLKQLGGFRAGYEGAQDWDLALRFTESLKPSQIVHIPRVLYHWRAIKGSTASHIGAKAELPHRSAQKALTDYCIRHNISGAPHPVSGHHWRIKRNPTPKFAPAIIVFRDPSHEQASGSPRSLAAQLNQLAREQAGDLLLFRPQSADSLAAGCINELTSQAVRPEIGAVGSLLTTSDNTIVHTGIIIEKSPHLNRLIIIPAFSGKKTDDETHFNRARLVQNFSAVGPAGFCIRREVFDRLGGFNEAFETAYGAVIDLCLRIRETGLRIVHTPFSQIYHQGPPPLPISEHDNELLYKIWQTSITPDPAYNPNLSLAMGGFDLAFPPRQTKPAL